MLGEPAHPFLENRQDLFGSVELRDRAVCDETKVCIVSPDGERERLERKHARRDREIGSVLRCGG